MAVEWVGSVTTAVVGLAGVAATLVVSRTQHTKEFAALERQIAFQRGQEYLQVRRDVFARYLASADAFTKAVRAYEEARGDKAELASECKAAGDALSLALQHVLLACGSAVRGAVTDDYRAVLDAAMDGRNPAGARGRLLAAMHIELNYDLELVEAALSERAASS
jgi:hypothetical protein